MAGTKNDTLIGKNADFSQAGGPNAASSDANGLNTNGQLWIGSTAPNAGSTHINVGTLTSPDSSIIIGYTTPNITLVAGATVATTYTANSGSAVPIANVLRILGSTTSAGTNPLVTTGGGNTITVVAQRSQAIAAGDATKVGLANFNSTDFTVTAAGFVSLTGTNLTVTAQRFTTTGAFTYTPTANMRYVIVELQGAGGGSGGCAAVVTNLATAGGGSGGAYAKFILTAAQVGASLTGSVGAGGTAGASGNNNGGNGGNTTLATSAAWTAGGGTGGAGSAEAATIVVNQVAGGTVTTGTGTILLTVDGGVTNAATSNAALVAFGIGGGHSMLGIPGPATNECVGSNGSAGVPTKGYGAGAAGAINYGGTGAKAGAAGGDGIAIFTEFVFI